MSKPVTKKTRYCENMSKSGECKHGKKCLFAHSLEELYIYDCSYEDKCIFITKKNEEGHYENTKNKICYYIHPGETKEKYLLRTKQTLKEKCKPLFSSTYSTPVTSPVVLPIKQNNPNNPPSRNNPKDFPVTSMIVPIQETQNRFDPLYPIHISGYQKMSADNFQLPSSAYIPPVEHVSCANYNVKMEEGKSHKATMTSNMLNVGDLSHPAFPIKEPKELNDIDTITLHVPENMAVKSLEVAIRMNKKNINLRICDT